MAGMTKHPSGCLSFVNAPQCTARFSSCDRNRTPTITIEHTLSLLGSLGSSYTHTRRYEDLCNLSSQATRMQRRIFCAGINVLPDNILTPSNTSPRRSLSKLLLSHLKHWFSLRELGLGSKPARSWILYCRS